MNIWALTISIALIVLGVFGGGLYKSFELTFKTKLRRSVGALATGFGVWLLISVLVHEPPGPEIECHDTIEAALADGERRQVPVWIDFTAAWCHNCHVLKDEALNTPEVVSRSDEFACAIIDVTDETDPRNEELRQRYGALSLPTIVFLDDNSEAMVEPVIHDVVDAEGFLEAFEAARLGGVGGYPSPFHQALTELGLLATLGLLFIAGILTSLSPCVYPLIPITISIFGARQAKTKLEGLALSSVYVAGMVITYVVLGLIAASVGGLFGQALQSPAVLLSIGGLFAVLGLSSVGLFELRLPAGLQDKLSSGGRQGFVGALFMGLVAGIIAAPCVGPWLAGVLLFIFETQNRLLGTAFMTTFALGMGLLFLILGTFSSLISRLPRSGGWMEGLKATFGVVFIIVGVHYLSMVSDGFGGLVGRLTAL